MTTGQRIKTARKKEGLTQKELGEKLGITYQTVAQWENDLRNPKRETLQRIAAALGVSAQDLTDDWGVVDKEDSEKVSIYEEGPDPKERIATALDKLNITGANKVADYAEDLTGIPRYTAPEPPVVPSIASEGADTTLPLDGPEGPQDGQK